MRIPALAVIAAVLAAGPACRALAPVPISMDMPGIARVSPGAFDEIVVSIFREDGASPDFEAGREFQAYLAAELRRVFKGPVTAAAAAPAGHGRAVVLAGSVRLVKQVRKALQNTNVPVDGPFKTAGRGLIEQCHWNLSLDLSAVSAVSGELLYHRTFEEERDYIDLEKPAEFAFSELAARVRTKLFSALLGTSSIESRTLLQR
jgi:hypothetical protein